MILVDIEYEKDELGNRLDSSQNRYADLLAADISRSSFSCPDGHNEYPSAEIVLGIVQGEHEKLVDIIAIKKACCISFRKHLQDDLKTEMKY